MRRILLSLAVLWPALLGGVAQPAGAAPERRVWVASIVPSPDYPSNPTLYSVQQPFDCETRCTKLMRSADGGGSWVALPARGWSGSQVLASNLANEDVLLSPVKGGIQVSRDGGKSFETFPGPTGQVDPQLVSGKALAVLVSGDHQQHLLTVPDGETRAIPGSALQSAQLVFHPSWPDVPAGQPAALASGSHPRTGLPVLQRCDASFSCSGGTIIDTKSGVAPVYVSPSFARDRTIFAAHIRGGLFRSDDGGASFRPVVVAPEHSRQLISTVQAMAFSPDFDAAAPRGSVYAGLLSVSGKPGGDGKLTGGVYRSRDGGTTWSKVGGPSDLDQGVTALAAAGDRVLAAPLGAFTKPVAPILCSVELGPWRSSCPSLAATPEDPAGPGAQSRSRSRGPRSDGDPGGRDGKPAERAEALTRAGKDRTGDASSSSPGRVVAIVLGLLVVLLCAAALLGRRQPKETASQ